MNSCHGTKQASDGTNSKHKLTIMLTPCDTLATYSNVHNYFVNFSFFLISLQPYWLVTIANNLNHNFTMYKLNDHHCKQWLFNSIRFVIESELVMDSCFASTYPPQPPCFWEPMPCSATMCSVVPSPSPECFFPPAVALLSSLGHEAVSWFQCLLKSQWQFYEYIRQCCI